MNKLPTEKRIQILGMMVEGMSVRAITRLTGVSKNTVAKFLVDVGQACTEYQDRTLRNLSCKRVQVDEIWAFCYAKAKNPSTAKNAPDRAGDLWTWTATDTDTKLAVCWLVGDRSGETAKLFIGDLAKRLANRVQLTSDGHSAYLQAVEEAFGGDIDYSQLIKIYGQTDEGQRRYNPPECAGCERKSIEGKPDPKHISTSFVERNNLNIRMHLRRFKRLTNAFSKKAENHAYAVAVNFMYYNFVRLHQTLKVTPAMAAGVTPKLWELADIVRVVDDWEAAQKAA